MRRVVRQKKKGPIDPSFGVRLRTLRLAQSKTQADLAGADFSKGFISLVETGRTRVSVRAADILAARLRVPLTFILSDASASGDVPSVADLLAQALSRAREVEEDSRRAQREIRDALTAWTRQQRASDAERRRIAIAGRGGATPALRPGSCRW